MLCRTSSTCLCTSPRSESCWDGPGCQRFAESLLPVSSRLPANFRTFFKMPGLVRLMGRNYPCWVQMITQTNPAMKEQTATHVSWTERLSLGAPPSMRQSRRAACPLSCADSLLLMRFLATELQLQSADLSHALKAHMHIQLLHIYSPRILGLYAVAAKNPRLENNKTRAIPPASTSRTCS